MSLYAALFWTDLLKMVHNANLIKENAELKQQIKNDVQKTLQLKFPNTPLQVRFFGSRIMGVGDSESDLDIYLVIGNSSGVYNEKLTPKVLFNLRTIVSAILANRTEWELTAVKDRFFPLVTAVHKGTNIKCDINFLNRMSCDQNQLVNYIFKLQPIARYMVIFLRAWSQKHGLSRCFRSHIFILLVIFFLQVQGHLPAIKDLQTDLVPNVAPWTSNFHEFPLSKFGMREIGVNENKTRQILHEFFKLYSTFPFHELVVCPYLGKRVSRQQLKDLMPSFFKYPVKSPVFVQDLILLDHNKGFQVKQVQIYAFQDECCAEIENYYDDYY
ncbi:terminal uridylyltransferase Tailor-like isoform X2 [Drosophila miranda]|uniref:terminal uridylyltransferase Tailor-like isoform X2 n=1 Tax=Drosophila miranda TaxID=7229 RepID=UPI0007E63C5F|nr:terminal uridylyltransferase Tailor-like isoform X2 [Drosophila miranda]